MADSVFDQFKIWFFPSIVSILGMMIWSDVNEIKADVKVLMAQSNIDKTRIDNLERQVYKSTARSTEQPYKLPNQVNMHEVLAIINKNDLTPKEYETFN